MATIKIEKEMKRTMLLLTATIALAVPGMAQKLATKKDTTRYQKIVKLSVNDYSTLISLAEAYKQSVIYNPKITDKTKEQQDVDMWLFGLPKRILIDSVRVK